VYRNRPFTLLIIFLILMAVMVYFCEPLMASSFDLGHLIACKSSDQGGQSSANSGQGVSDAGNSEAGIGGRSASVGGMESQNDTSSEGNGGDPQTPLIDCDNPFWWDFLPCRRGK
jgi:hypothetical protein